MNTTGLTCPYCFSEIYMHNEEVGGCEFCGYKGVPYFEGERIHVERKEFVELKEAEQPVFILDGYHTANLLLLLSYARKERAEQYKYVSTFNKAIDAGAQEFEKPADEQGNSYDYWTRRCWVIENILKKRMGYFPKRITNDLYEQFLKRCEESEGKKMYIRKERREKSN